MNKIVKNSLISLAISLIAFVIIGFLHPSSFLSLDQIIPSSSTQWLNLAVIFCAVFSATFLGKPSDSNYVSYTETGTVKWFNVKKGYGFITRDVGDDIFVHYRNLQGSGRRAIEEGQRVQFVVIDGDKGLQADEVEAI